MEERRQRILILYGSQTGNAQDVAERIGREAERRGCTGVVRSMGDFDSASLSKEKTVIFVVSTTGQGDIPDTMKVFWKFLLLRSLGQSWLQEVQFAVFGLGDSGYQKYNFAAKKLDKRLSDLGAKSIVAKGLGDDQHISGYEGALDPWLSSLWNMLHKLEPTTFSRCAEDIDLAAKILDSPKFKIIYHNADKLQSLYAATSDLKYTEMQIENARLMSPRNLNRNKTKPHCFLQMIKNQQLAKVDDERDVRHFEFEALSSDIVYQVGDVLEILPSQNDVAVEAFIQRCNLDPDSYITVEPKSVETDILDINVPRTPIKLRTFVELAMDITSASPRRYFFEVMSYFASADHEKERLEFFSSPEGRNDLYQYNQKECRTVLEVLEDFPSVQMPFEWLVQLVPTLKTRPFSISSSPAAHPNQVHLTVSVVSWMTPFKRKRLGFCSTWLARLDPQKGVQIPVWFNRGSLPPPSPSLPLILIGPGTGCAPFRGFIAEREVQSRLEPTAPILFFFGCRNEETDILYKNFWISHTQNGGVLSEEKGGGFFIAFSRDQKQKVYVQHKMKEQSRKVWNLLSAGAAIYIAGSSTKMPTDVFTSLEEIISKESGVSKESAGSWLRSLEKVGKYHVEAWS